MSNSEKIKNIVFACFFIEAGLINLLLSIILECFKIEIPNGVVEIVKYCFYGIIFIYIFWAYIKTIIKINLLSLRVIVFTLPCIFIFPEVYNCIVSSWEFDAIVYLFKYIVFIIPVYFIGICIILNGEKADIAFMKYYKYIALLLSPFFVFYLIRMTFPENPIVNYSNFGLLDYMSMGYFILPIFLGSFLEWALLSETRKDKILSILSGVLCFICIICTGTRGAILVTICFALLLFIYAIICKQNIKKIFLFMAFIIFVNIFAQYVWQPTGSRFGKKFIDDITYSKVVETYKESGFLAEGSAESREKQSAEFIEARSIILQYAVENDLTYAQSVKKALKEIKMGNVENVYKGKIADSVLHELYELEEEDLMTLSRKPLIEISIMEFNKNKLFGNGCYHYINKYTYYPHNAICELMCDTGIIGTMFFVSSIISILILTRKLLIKCKNIAIMLIFTLSYTPSYLISGSVYMDLMIPLFITIGTITIVANKNNNLMSSENENNITE